MSTKRIHFRTRHVDSQPLDLKVESSHVPREGEGVALYKGDSELFYRVHEVVWCFGDQDHVIITLKS